MHYTRPNGHHSSNVQLGADRSSSDLKWASSYDQRRQVKDRTTAAVSRQRGYESMAGVRQNTLDAKPAAGSANLMSPN